MIPTDDDVIAALEPLLLPRRADRMKTVLGTRTEQVAFVFERMVDPHNFSAAVRSLDAFSFQDIHLVTPDTRVGMARGITQGTDRWLSLHEHDDMASCSVALRNAGYRVLASHLPSHLGGGDSTPLDALDLREPTALVFGNEHAGVSDTTLALADGTFQIEMLGFVESLNLSVAAAVSAFHARRELDRLATEAAAAGDPDRYRLPEGRRRAIYAGWLRRSVRNADRIVADSLAGSRAKVSVAEPFGESGPDC